MTDITPIPKSECPSEPERFRTGQANAQKKYSEFVQAGIGNSSNLGLCQAQSLLGVEEFAEGLRHLVTEKQQIRETEGQRFVRRPSLEKLISQSSRGKAFRDRLIAEAVTAHGYSQMEVASFAVPPLFDDQPNLVSNRIANLKTFCLALDLTRRASVKKGNSFSHMPNA